MNHFPKGTLRVSDIMVGKPIAVKASATPRELARLMTEHAISGLPVVNADDHVIGVVSKTDLLQWCVRGGLGFGASDLLRNLADGGSGSRLEAVDLGIVADFMTPNPLTAHPDESISAVAQRMAAHHVHRLIVTDEEGCLLGIISSMDVLKAIPAPMPDGKTSPGTSETPAGKCCCGESSCNNNGGAERMKGAHDRR